MNITQPLSGSHLRTYNTIFQHPISHNLGWNDVHALFRHLGEVEEKPNGNLKVSRNGQVLMLHPSIAKDVETDELMGLRHFLERSAQVPDAPKESVAQWLLVIDHREARIFQSEVSGTIPQRILPPSDEADLRPTARAKDFSRGQEKPDPNVFFTPVAEALKAAGQILIFGSGKGKGSEMEQFVAWLKLKHAELANRIVGTVVIDEHHSSDGQLLAKAREFYARTAAPGNGSQTLPQPTSQPTT